jgi:DNA-binding MltR family transcriptional regulator
VGILFKSARIAEGIFQVMDRLAAYNNMVDVYAKESDRAAAILAASFLDNTLRELLQAKMVDHPKVTALFEGDRPLATFSARTSLAFGLGLLRPNVYADLELIRKIRNHFAHFEGDVSFRVSPVRDWCAELSMVKPQSGVAVESVMMTSDPRVQFLMTVAGTTVYLDRMADGFRKGPLRRCVVPASRATMQDPPKPS